MAHEEAVHGDVACSPLLLWQLVIAAGKCIIRQKYHTSMPRQMKFAGKRLRTERQQNIAMTHTKYTPLQ